MFNLEFNVMPFTRFRSSKFNPCRVVRRDDEGVVQDGLALTPSKVAEMTRAGIPISTVNAMGFHDGYRTLDFEPFILNRRGVDMIDAWNAQMDSRKKLRDAAKSAPAQEGAE